MPLVPSVGDTLLDRYYIEDVLDAEGNTAVLRCFDTRLDVPQVVKYLLGDSSSPEWEIKKQHFIHSFRTQARLNHPNIVHVSNIETRQGHVFSVMELLQGTTLKEYALATELTMKEVVELFLSVVDAMSLAHHNNVVHMSLSPHNIFLTQQGNRLSPRILNIAAMRELDKLSPTEDYPYLAPEQFSGFSQATAASDVYALCVSMYAMFAGKPPVVFDSFEQYVAYFNESDGISYFPESIPSDFVPLLAMGLRANPSERFANAAELLKALKQMSEGMKLSSNLTIEASRSIPAMTSVTPSTPIQMARRSNVGASVPAQLSVSSNPNLKSVAASDEDLGAVRRQISSSVPQPSIVTGSSQQPAVQQISSSRNIRAQRFTPALPEEAILGDESENQGATPSVAVEAMSDESVDQGATPSVAVEAMSDDESVDQGATPSVAIEAMSDGSQVNQSATPAFSLEGQTRVPAQVSQPVVQAVPGMPNSQHRVQAVPQGMVSQHVMQAVPQGMVSQHNMQAAPQGMVSQHNMQAAPQGMMSQHNMQAVPQGMMSQHNMQAVPQGAMSQHGMQAVPQGAMSQASMQQQISNVQRRRITSNANRVPPPALLQELYLLRRMDSDLPHAFIGAVSPRSNPEQQYLFKCFRARNSVEASIFNEAVHRTQILHAESTYFQEILQVHPEVCAYLMPDIGRQSLVACIQKNGRFDPVVTTQIGVLLAQNMELAHSKGFVNGNLKPSNILFEDKNGVVTPVIYDFGQRLYMENTQCLGILDIPCIAPELHYNFQHSNAQSDIFGFGMCLIYMLLGVFPYQSQRPDTLLEEISMVGVVPNILSWRHDIPDDLVQIIQWCTAFSPSERYVRFSDVLRDLYVVFQKMQVQGQHTE